ncbi:hypothetical protein [Streptomyces sp. SID4985]|uniref:hypothetical protein n=1 Tax=unclassified Streptomyces TaxID=2593676 RepID=UPI0013718858|nr:hypothetical protein [Streptomyces sp. SID4985]MYQ43980.1 hypothetical protein [Streptomyces sp. SID4985]
MYEAASEASGVLLWLRLAGFILCGIGGLALIIAVASFFTMRDVRREGDLESVSSLRRNGIIFGFVGFLLVGFFFVVMMI